MNKDDFEWWTNFREGTHTSLNHQEYEQVCEIYARVKNFKVHYPCKGCGDVGKILQGYIDEINFEYEMLKKC